MEGITLGLTIGGVIIGAVITFIVSKYFFKKGVKEKSLTPFLQFSSRLFSELDPELKKELIVNYKNHKIDNITQTQFLIANDGDIPIRDIIEPLKLSIPKKNKIFSASIIHIEPEGRTVNYKVTETETENIIEFDIPLLNAGEYFVVKLLLQDSLPSDEKEVADKIEYAFTITADDLQPQLDISRLPYSYYEEESEKKYDWSGFWVSLIFGLLLVSVLGVLYAFKSANNGLYLFSLGDFFSGENFSFYSVCIILLALMGLIFLILTIIGIAQSISELTPNPKPKFKVPNKLRKEKLHPYPFEIFEK
jgi:hypothetical protein